MSSFRSTASTLRRVAVAVGGASVAMLGLSGPANASVDGVTGTVIDTYSTWDGTSYLAEWGHPNTATYGQVITVAAGSKKLRSYSFYMTGYAGAGTITYRGEVYGWDGTKATDKVWQSKRQKIDVDSTDPSVGKAAFRLRGARLTPGEQYVLFATVSKDYETTDPNVTSQWATHTDDVLPDSYVVYINDSGDETQWTTQPWSVIDSYDFAMKAKLR